MGMWEAKDIGHERSERSEVEVAYTHLLLGVGTEDKIESH